MRSCRTLCCSRAGVANLRPSTLALSYTSVRPFLWHCSVLFPPPWLCASWNYVGVLKYHRQLAINKFAWPVTHSWVLISSTDPVAASHLLQLRLRLSLSGCGPRSFDFSFCWLSLQKVGHPCSRALSNSFWSVSTQIFKYHRQLLNSLRQCAHTATFQRHHSYGVR